MKSNRKTNNKQITSDFVSLDGFVAEDKSQEIIYVLFDNDPQGDVAICNKSIKPESDDKVLCRMSGKNSIKNYSDLVKLVSPLRLVARNGQRIETAVSDDSCEIVGVITHHLKSLRTGGAR
jgi:hypothetical protein